jgi:hypothetical protein
MNPEGERLYVRAGHCGSTTKRVQDLLAANPTVADVVAADEHGDIECTLKAGESLPYPNAQFDSDRYYYNRLQKRD